MMTTARMDPAEATAQWLSQFETALAAADESLLRPLFHAESHWRDVLALTWRIGTVSGQDAVARALGAGVERGRPSGFAVDPQRTPPRRVTRAGVETVEGIFRFETVDGRGAGVVRLTGDDGGTPRAWTLLTALEELRGHEERIGRRRVSGDAYARDFRGPNWLDQRRSAATYADRDPTVLVVGGGHAGLSAAARLGQLGLDTLIVDRWPRIGDNWRQRYHALTLHNQVQVNHLPYMPFPPTWPTYIPKDKLAGWFEQYVESLELNYWPGTEFMGGTYDERAGRWRATLGGADGARREVNPRHVILATGVSGIPHIPDIPSLGEFRGTVMHSSRYDDGTGWAGKKALVIGTGNSGHDIAQDLQSSGAHVTLVQRSPTLIINVEPSAQLPYALYDEGPPLEDCDLITAATPLAVTRRSHQLFTERARQIDRPLLERLERVGFRLDYGEDDTGWQFKYLTRGGGYYFNVGCSDLLADGTIRLLQFAEIERFVGDGARLRSGETLAADLIVLATGWKGQEELLRRLFGETVARRVGPVWGFGPDQELRNMFQRTPQPGLWFIAGSLAQCRIYSKYLALQVKAIELDVLPRASETAQHGPAKATAAAIGD